MKRNKLIPLLTFTLLALIGAAVAQSPLSSTDVGFGQLGCYGRLSHWP